MTRSTLSSFLVTVLALSVQAPSAEAQEFSVEAPQEAPQEAAPARVGPDRFQLGFAGGARFRSGFGYGLFTDSDRSGVGAAGMALAVDVVTIERFRLAAEFAFAHEELRSPAVQAIATELLTNDLELGLRAHFAVHPWVGPHVRVAGGWTLGDFSLSEPGRPTLTADVNAPYASLGGGVTVRTPKGLIPYVSLGVSIEGGYRFAAPLSVVAHPTRTTAPGDTPIATTAVDLGDLGRSAAYLRIDLFARY